MSVMSVRVLAVLALATAPWLMATSCGNHAKRQPVGYPCARDRDCEHELVCVGGICRAQPSDGAVSD